MSRTPSSAQTLDVDGDLAAMLARLDGPGPRLSFDPAVSAAVQGQSSAPLDSRATKERGLLAKLKKRASMLLRRPPKTATGGSSHPRPPRLSLSLLASLSAPSRLPAYSTPCLPSQLHGHQPSAHSPPSTSSCGSASSRDASFSSQSSCAAPSRCTATRHSSAKRHTPLPKAKPAPRIPIPPIPTQRQRHPYVYGARPRSPGLTSKTKSSTSTEAFAHSRHSSVVLPPQLFHLPTATAAPRTPPRFRDRVQRSTGRSPPFAFHYPSSPTLGLPSSPPSSLASSTDSEWSDPGLWLASSLLGDAFTVSESAASPTSTDSAPPRPQTPLRRMTARPCASLRVLCAPGAGHRYRWRWLT
ncbi:hypothetical protein MIND_00570700 [Mycena indigotica]|uniref:Uncharacterized protein n=1 Tax=Mycena indigotica TaxID=2126181 RepID=A0A8H6W5B8_9AGAR|nr:uncharacterized protein MIND_00570700 [Mycena indigotica]KAF7303421.1 hypothetical protein MIND_00570700 [Mycena indigotica]